MSTITRRAALVGIATMSTGPALASNETAKSNAVDDEWTLLRSFLEKASPAELMDYHLMRAADAAGKIRPGVWCIRYGLDHGFMMIVDYDHCRRQREKAEARS